MDCGSIAGEVGRPVSEGDGAGDDGEDVRSGRRVDVTHGGGVPKAIRGGVEVVRRVRLISIRQHQR